ncbi:uncharacterized protein LOC103704692 [Phoenix dactylifera]|uniref:Uncharacterized protein LOC103704692 n=1 Tax=Phoenix dactylifera TaxID=42345 RepID=A0A8B8J355_PHODC|nr:uncharacterized protein LOC103704692 [Phoenix dactylifera]
MWCAFITSRTRPAVRLDIFTPFLSFSSASMATATSSATPSLVGGSHLKTRSLQSNKLKMLARHQTQLAVGQNKRVNHRQNFSICAEYSNNSRGGGGDFLAGLVLGGAVFGTLAYVFSPQLNHKAQFLPQIRRSILNEDDEYGFRKAKRPIYYNDGLEKTRQTLTDKISQLNSAIDNVSSRLRGLRGGSNMATEPAEADSEVEATIVESAV